MKKIIFIICILAFAKASNAQEIKRVKIKDVVNMIDTAQSPILINFWATWCAPCVKEIPWFEKVVAEYKDQHVTLVLVSLDFKSAFPKELMAFVKKHNYTSTIVWLDETDADFFCPLIDKNWNGNIPVTIMVNNKKKYRQFFNQQLPEARLQLEIKKLVE
ncbi:MAG TPA: TlpA disulfide reductase family protein [Chitinophagaceae bacterium]|jgi:thiol-disulfide isomerase/thioredoxin|nr:TlpA family protein disulfide reductase [Chitinophagaceae bacterium]MBP9739687.1 TlpA family protein disulfide reductase [Chitinophagaceae bacterium]HPH22860.1 TlpA disulfide reductase family protein [Chitinophagaceae bacterium]